MMIFTIHIVLAIKLKKTQQKHQTTELNNEEYKTQIALKQLKSILEKENGLPHHA